MKYFFFSVVISILFFACKGKDESKALEISGTITNNSADMIYLEELPMATMQALKVDSAKVGKDGKYELQASEREASVYNLRLDQSNYPFAAVINDAKKISVNVTFSNDNKEFPEKYEVSGSPASNQMKDFMFVFNGLLQSIYFNSLKADSLHKADAPDSVVNALLNQKDVTAESARKLLDESLAKSTNPALTMFELGYYQTSANNSNYQLIPVDNDELKKLIDQLAVKFPAHSGLAAIKKTLAGFVGSPAPEFSLPDPNGKEIKLSSFRGKYLLLDFWASWCSPCRSENPNVVKAFNRFKDKNFTILSVSFDKPGEKDKWLKAIMDDHLTWNHVSDLMYWDSPVVSLYKIEGIPYNVLIDPSGNIIAEKLFGSKLEEKLAEVLK